MENGESESGKIIKAELNKKIQLKCTQWPIPFSSVDVGRCSVENVGSNPTGDMNDCCFLCVLCVAT
jgi:hypothetical protein